MCVAATLSISKTTAVFILLLLFWSDCELFNTCGAPDVHLSGLRQFGCSWTPCPSSGCRCCEGGRGLARECAPSRTAVGPGFSALLRRAPPLTAVPAGAQAVPRGDTDTSFGARRPRGRFGASTCRSGAPSPGREEESQACSSPALPTPPPSWACHGGGGGGSLPPRAGSLVSRGSCPRIFGGGALL